MEAPRPVTVLSPGFLIPSHTLTSNAYRAKYNLRTPSPHSMTSSPSRSYNTSPLEGAHSASASGSTSTMSLTTDSLRSAAYQGERAERARIVRGGKPLTVNTIHQRGYHPDELSPLPYPPSTPGSPFSIPESGYEQPHLSLPQPDSPTRSKYRDARPLPYFLRVLWPTSLATQLRRIPDLPSVWLALYFLLNLSLTLYNKSVLIKFPFPYTLTALHALCGSIGTFIWLRISQRGVPMSLTSTSSSTSTTGTSGVPVLSGPELVVLFLFSILYTINIVVSNASLRLVTVPFHQVVRSSTPLFTIMLAAMLVGRKPSRRKLLSLIPVVAGVGLATYGDYYFTILGFFLTLFGTILAAMKTVVTNMVLVKPSAKPALPTSTDSHALQSSLSSNNHGQPYSNPTSPLPVDRKSSYPNPHFRHTSPLPPATLTSSGSFIPPNFFSALFNLTINHFFPPSPHSSPIYAFKPLSEHSTSTPDHHVPLSNPNLRGLFSFPKLTLSPLHLLYLLSPLAFIQTTLLAHFTGELDQVRHYLVENGGHQRTWLLMNGVMAFFLNVVSFNANKKVGPVGMSVAGNVKQVLTVLCAVVIFDLTITPANGLGILLTLLGGALYAAVEIQEKKTVKKSRVV
ncbi:triose-phosphate transporter family-domain-containing protein [Crepidotus variabilis]|uniref:Triose-phosphate transporter family-domain-containing protein n=1 Tax=Crepidotus variabilis TaxID=179855 RepID=A0A9P6E757_9AGAR|nr:triose-phosphate transporter family-domain-containing protein [Crepidotus variabilis]